MLMGLDALVISINFPILKVYKNSGISEAYSSGSL
jgi:hypothetical protein